MNFKIISLRIYEITNDLLIYSYEFQGKSLTVEPARRIFPRGGHRGRKFQPGGRDRRRSYSRSSSR
jgi:hypothetical protein